MKDILQNILPKYLPYEDLSNLSLVNKNYHSMMKDIVKKTKQDIQDRIKELFPEFIIDMVGKNRFLSAKEIEWSDKYLGNTEYIDRVRYKNFINDQNSIYFGKDRYSRPFIFVKVRNITENKKGLIIIFQRYSGDNFKYVSIDPTSVIYEFFGGRCLIDTEFEDNFKLLFSGQYNNVELTD